MRSVAKGGGFGGHSLDLGKPVTRQTPKKHRQYRKWDKKLVRLTKHGPLDFVVAAEIHNGFEPTMFVLPNQRVVVRWERVLVHEFWIV